MIGVLVIVAILITITALIFAQVYNNNQNVARDKFYATHCSVVQSDRPYTANTGSGSQVFKCVK
jgi:hypothetical protein